MYPGAKVVWAQDEAGEIGKRPTLPADQFEISAETVQALAEHRAYMGRKRR